jgi:hypothetical protein
MGPTLTSFSPGSSPSTGAEAALDAWEVDPPMGSKKGRTSRRSARQVTTSYRDKASSLSPSSSFSPETILEGDSSSESPSRLY